MIADDAALVLDDVEAPPTLVALIAARLDALTANERRLVHDASVIGESFDRAHLLLLTDVPDPLQVLDELVRKQVLTLQVDRFSSEVGQYRFVQGLVRTVAYDTLARRDRKARHLAVARLLLEQGDEVAAIAARHHLDAIDAVPDDPDVPELIVVAVDLLALRRDARKRWGRPTRPCVCCGTPSNAPRRPTSTRSCSRPPPGRPGTSAVTRNPSSSRSTAVEAWRARGSELDVARATASMAMALHDVGQLQATIDVAGPVHEAFSDRPEAAGVVVALCESLYRAHANLGDHRGAAAYARQGLRLAEGLEDAEGTAAFMARVGNLDLGGRQLPGGAGHAAGCRGGRACQRQPQATAVP